MEIAGFVTVRLTEGEAFFFAFAKTIPCPPKEVVTNAAVKNGTSLCSFSHISTPYRYIVILLYITKYTIPIAKTVFYIAKIEYLDKKHKINL